MLGHFKNCFVIAGQEVFGVRAFKLHDVKDLLEGEQYHVSDGGYLFAHINNN